ncbi:hypothetical protein ScPMuIL_000015 [Solemya velum]
MVLIHGGGFEMGEGSVYDRTSLALTGDVIVVSFNYCLGIFGFLSTGDSASRGNFGLWDQRLAIQWVKDHIAEFGGNLSSITIFGQSAGGFSVFFKSVPPLNGNLFHRAVAGSGFGSWQGELFHDTLEITNAVADSVSCPSVNGVVNTSVLMNCMRNRSAAELVFAMEGAMAPYIVSGRTIFRTLKMVVIDGEIIPADPFDLMKNRYRIPVNGMANQYTSIDLLTGLNDGDGSIIYYISLLTLQDRYNYNVTEGVSTCVMCDVLSPLLSQEHFHGNIDISQAICLNYTSNGDKMKQGQRITDFCRDYLFVWRTLLALRAHELSSNYSTYMYVFSHRPEERGLVPSRLRPSWLSGANHGDEVAFALGLDDFYMNITNISDEETHLSRVMMSYWSNFAKYGNPNGPGLVQWPKFDAVNGNYLNLDMNNPVDHHPFKEADEFGLESKQRF